MAKLHTRQIRYLSKVTGRNRKKRPKTFKTEESAKRYAEAKDIKNYELVDLQESNPNKKKIRIAVE